ncbi:MAG: hypothetical protein V3V00_10325 [Saprospiraceae bacterium]
MTKSTFLLLVSSLLLFSVSCKWKTTKDALKHGEKLKSSIEDFEKNRQQLSVKLVKSLEEAEEDLTSENPDLPKVSKDFEKQWTGIQNKYKDLQEDFTKVGETSEAFFAKLNELSSNINNEKLRNDELRKNDVLKNKWDKSFYEASSSIQKVTGVLEAGNDFHMVLVASSIRQKLEQNVTDLNKIAVQAKELLGDLESFTKAGRELVSA